jgi:hypothetical protein
MGECPLPPGPPQIGGKRRVGRPREMGHGSARSRGKAVRFIGPYCLRPERHLWARPQDNDQWFWDAR